MKVASAVSLLEPRRPVFSEREMPSLQALVSPKVWLFLFFFFSSSSAPIVLSVFISPIPTSEGLFEVGFDMLLCAHTLTWGGEAGKGGSKRRVEKNTYNYTVC